MRNFPLITSPGATVMAPGDYRPLQRPGEESKRRLGTNVPRHAPVAHVAKAWHRRLCSPMPCPSFQSFTLTSGRAAMLAVPLREPFVIATATMTATRAVLVELTLDDGSTGLGEGATLPPVTHEDEHAVLSSINAWLAAHVGKTFEGAPRTALEGMDTTPVTRAALECALLDALAKREQRTVRALFAGDAKGASERASGAPMDSGA